MVLGEVRTAKARQDRNTRQVRSRQLAPTPERLRDMETVETMGIKDPYSKFWRVQILKLKRFEVFGEDSPLPNQRRYPPLRETESVMVRDAVIKF